jgi:hypothetical protein
VGSLPSPDAFFFGFEDLSTGCVSDCDRRFWIGVCDHSIREIKVCDSKHVTNHHG